MTYEEKMEALARVKPENKDKYLLQLLQGKTIDLTKDEDLFYQVNKNNVSLEQFVSRDKFKADAEEMKVMRSNLVDGRLGMTEGKRMRLLGEMPAEIYYARKEFSDPNIPKEERAKAMKKFFNEFSAFRAGDRRI